MRYQNKRGEPAEQIAMMKTLAGEAAAPRISATARGDGAPGLESAAGRTAWPAELASTLQRPLLGPGSLRFSTPALDGSGGRVQKLIRTLNQPEIPFPGGRHLGIRGTGSSEDSVVLGPYMANCVQSLHNSRSCDSRAPLTLGK